MGQAEQTTSLAVIGAGPAGYAGAFRAADLGIDVTLIDTRPNPGGVCLYCGCIPSKALLHVQALLDELELAPEWGVSCADVKVDIEKLRAWKDSVVRKLTGGLGQLCRQRKVRYVRGRARFVGSRELAVELRDGGTERLAFEHALVATGSVPATLPGLPDSPLVMDSERALDVERVPERLLVVGGGYIGLELGQVYAALGSRVTLVELTSELLPGTDRDLVGPLAARLGEQFEAVLMESKVVGIEEAGGGLRARIEGEAIEEPEQDFDGALVAVGRKPDAGRIGLENTDAAVNEGGFIEVDQQLRTADPAVFAAGDVANPPMLAHKGSHEAFVAAEVIAGRNVTFEPQAVPAVVFTDPAVACTGLTERQAEEQGREVRVARFPWRASGRAATFGRSDGLTKLIVDPQTERVLGMGICGADCAELIAVGTLAIEMGAVARDLALVIQQHPTLAETVMEAAQSIVGRAIHFGGG